MVLRTAIEVPQTDLAALPEATHYRTANELHKETSAGKAAISVAQIAIAAVLAIVVVLVIAVVLAIAAVLATAVE